MLWGCGGIGTPIDCWWGFKLVHRFEGIMDLAQKSANKSVIRFSHFTLWEFTHMKWNQHLRELSVLSYLLQLGSQELWYGMNPNAHN